MANHEIEMGRDGGESLRPPFKWQMQPSTWGHGFFVLIYFVIFLFIYSCRFTRPCHIAGQFGKRCKSVQAFHQAWHEQ